MAVGRRSKDDRKQNTLAPLGSGGPNLCWQAGCWEGRGVDWLGQLPQGNVSGQTVHLIIGGPCYTNSLHMKNRGGTTWKGGKNWILPKDINANRLFRDSHWLEIWKNHLCPSIGPNGGSVAMTTISVLDENRKPSTAPSHTHWKLVTGIIYSFKFTIAIVGHRHRGWCRRHRYSGIHHLSPVPKHSGTGLGLPPYSRPNGFGHPYFFSFRYRIDRMPDSPTFRKSIKL